MKNLSILFAFVMASFLYSADTTETFELGFSDYEYYYGISNLKDNEKTFSHELTMGVGITPLLASTISIGSEKFGEEYESSYTFGLFFNAYDSKHFDFDFYASMDKLFELGLGFELNLDLKDDLALAGLYMRGELVAKDEIDSYSITLGAYYAIFENAQILMEFDLAIPAEEDMEIGGLSLGFNYVFSDRFELITDFNINIPQKDEEFNYSFSVGFISTLL